ncbi:hypothetical protein M8J75_010603 [Diaphorina citri]|nr:hypothetical protein M8J75_010603 [Diaphorina citri]
MGDQEQEEANGQFPLDRRKQDLNDIEDVEMENNVTPVTSRTRNTYTVRPLEKTSDEEELKFSTPRGTATWETPALRNRGGKGIKRTKKRSPVLDDVSKEFMNIVEEMIKKANQLEMVVENIDLEITVRETIDELASWAKAAKRVKENIRYQPSKRPDITTGEALDKNVEINKLMETINKQKNQIKEQQDEAEEILKKQNIKIKALQEKAQEFYETSRVCTKCKKKINEEEICLEKTKSQLQRVSELSNNEILELIGNKWPEPLFKKTNLKNGNPFDSTNLETKSIILVTGQDDNSVLLRTAITRYPELVMLQEEESTDIEEGEEKDTYRVLESSVKIGKKVIHNKVYFVKTDNKEDITNALEKILGTHAEESLSIAATEKHDWSTLRKITEIKCIRYNKEVTFFVPHNSKQRPNTMIQLKEPSKKKFKEINVAIPQEKKSEYDTILKKIKGEVHITENEAEVVSISKTKEVNIKMLVNEKEQGAAERLEKKINECIGEIAKASVLMPRNEYKTVIIKDIDTTVSKEELNENLEKATGTNDMKILNLKLNYAGSFQTALVLFTPPIADKLIRQGKIKLDWSWARVDEMVTITRCFKCLGFGHVSYECSAEEGSRNTCFKCGKEGHRANSCNEIAYCKTCDIAGHRSDSMACPEYRKLVVKKKMEIRSQEMDSNLL